MACSGSIPVQGPNFKPVFLMQKSFVFVVTYTNDIRLVELRAYSEEEAIEIIHYRAKKALLKVVSIAPY
jgi:hypothetical protein